MNCTLCPRRCGAPRTGGKNGFCGVPEDAMVCRAAPHFGEEPCISGTRGSGAVFFAGCNLRCVFCQNHAISRGAAGEAVSVARLREIFLSLRDRGVHNLNLVTPTHYADVIAEALSGISLDMRFIARLYISGSTRIRPQNSQTMIFLRVRISICCCAGILA
jgi:putative pyruvate formate lyase activating enzyme